MATHVPYNVDGELWVFKRPSVVEMKKQYEDMIARINAGDPEPFKSTNIEKVIWLRRKRLQVPTEDKRPKIFSRFSLSIPLTLKLKEVEPEPEPDPKFDPATNTRRIETVEEWWGEFHAHNPNFRYEVVIGSLSIGDQAVIELCQKLTELIAKMIIKPTVPSVDMSWNDMYEEGTLAFSGVLENLTGVADLRMDGNQLGTQGLTSILNALVKAQPKEKKKSAGSFKLGAKGTPPASSSPKNSPAWKRTDDKNTAIGVALTIRETNIGDDSTTSLASFLKPIPDLSKQLNLTSLDVTNTYIFDGITALTLALQQNTMLQTLILNSNMIGDQGAFAIGELLMVNRTLSKLEMRNCDIGPTGTAHLCEGLNKHPGLRLEKEGAMFMIDVGLNPWEFPGEVMLLQTALSKPKMTINWREGEWIPNDDDELPTLIRTFGEKVIMDMLMDGKGLLPLASPAQLIASPLMATHAPGHFAKMIDSLNPAKCTENNNTHNSALPVLTIIVQILQEHGKTHYQAWADTLPQILTHLSSWMDPKKAIKVKHRRQIEVLTVDLLRVLCNINQLVVEDIVIKSRILDLCLENFFTHPNHNVYHIHLVSLIQTLCTNTESKKLRERTLTLISGDFFTRLQAIIKEQSCLTPKQRSGSFSASLLFARAIEPYLETRNKETMKKLIQQYENEQKGHLGGPPPERSANKMVFNKEKEV